MNQKNSSKNRNKQDSRKRVWLSVTSATVVPCSDTQNVNEAKYATAKPPNRKKSKMNKKLNVEIEGGSASFE